ncbi:NADH:flavin oxidoreductase/NADH oxidase [Colletotrichum tofieldiae]|uniref:NADH:flavin oxidoreductase/NADH oxidase n=1 Tax=Colletotrichum tofieldiae TaxID=708197 RepID=A0A161YA35_9PEZI|nr:NADH:flavin oxidoreductase/NADH oxidase [Colletotrichum tofieldiae]GKT53052.1 NADH:flavin oxidoreductase/NADH oxidase [Colletotrichum tofieldiae]GKT80550.1 NADH:flavin oxidoreductase/NADH oxidase [Colletotrichum tofieldiae]
MPTRYPGRQDADPAPLAQPLSFPFSTTVAPNRLMKGAMTERVCTWDTADVPKRGVPTEELVTLYRNWGTGGWGILLSGNILIDPEHLEAAGNPVISLAHEPVEGDERFELWRRVAAAGKAGGSLLLGQINHPGRQVINDIQKDPVSASDVQLMKEFAGMKFNKPHAATAEEIRQLTDSFVHSAVYLEKAGFDGVQLHGAHGYLMAQFLSQTTNKRTDAYGGSLRNRARLITDIADAIRTRTGPGFVLGIKINSVEFQESGFTVAEAAELCQLLEEHKFDFVELSGGTYEQTAWHHRRESTRAREAFFLEFAEKIVPHVSKTRTFVTGGVRSVGAMVDILQAGLDGVGIGRPACTEPRLPNDIFDNGLKSCIKPWFDEQDFGLGSALSGAQMRQLGRNEEPLDPSDQTSADGLLKDLAAWTSQVAKSEGRLYGFVKTESVPVSPYANAAQAKL